VHGGWRARRGPLDRRVSARRRPSSNRKEVEKPFFDRFLLGGRSELPRRSCSTPARTSGSLRSLAAAGITRRVLALGAGGTLSITTPRPPAARSRATSAILEARAAHAGDRARHEQGVHDEDQRFAARRPDVVTFQTEPLPEDVTIAGSLHVRLRVSTDGTDADWIVKLVDVYPDSAPDRSTSARRGAEHERLPHARARRGDARRFRRGYETPSRSSRRRRRVPFALWTCCTLQEGPPIQVQVQSTWFPLVRATRKSSARTRGAAVEDMRAATHAIHAGSRIEVGVLPAAR